MGGDTTSFVWISSSDDDSSLDAGETIQSPVSSEVDESSRLKLENGYESSLGGGEYNNDECLIPKLENGSVINGYFGLGFGETTETLTSKSKVAESRKSKIYMDVLRSYENVKCRTERLDEVKRMVLSYTPGSWVEMAGGSSNGYDVPKSTSLLLIGPKASGKSSLVNRISQVLEDEVFTSARAQVSHSQLSEDGTYFTHQYMIPRRSGSFCLFDTRGLSVDTNENLKVVKFWMRKGIRHGELLIRKSDSTALKAQLKCKKHGVESSSQRRVINFVIFVVDGLSVLEAMNGGSDIKNEYCQSMATIFNNPLLSFRDDKPVLVVTHGDLLSLSDRVNIRVYLGELFRIPPTTQIFDIPETDDSATQLTTLDMLIYCLEHADRNLSVKKQHADKKLPVQTRPVNIKLPVQKQHPDNMPPVKKKLANKNLPVDYGFADMVTWYILLWGFCFISIILVVVSCHFYCSTPATTKYSIQPSHPYAPANQTQQHGTHAPANQTKQHGTQATTNESHGNIDHASNLRETANQSKEHGTQDSRRTDSTTNENGAHDSYPHNPAHASLINEYILAHQPTADKARKNVDEDYHSHASRRNDAKACHSHPSTHKSEARRVKVSKKDLEPTGKIGNGLKVEWHKIRHIWSE